MCKVVPSLHGTNLNNLLNMPFILAFFGVIFILSLTWKQFYFNKQTNNFKTMTTTNTTAAQVEALNSYQQAIDFLNSTNTKFKAVYLKHDFYFLGDKQRRDIYRITLSRTGKRYSFTFGQSIAGAGKVPTPYDVLACLQKYDVETFEDFCSEFGYDEDSRSAEKIYKAVCKEWANIQNLFTESEIEILREIQ